MLSHLLTQRVLLLQAVRAPHSLLWRLSVPAPLAVELALDRRILALAWLQDSVGGGALWLLQHLSSLCWGFTNPLFPVQRPLCGGRQNHPLLGVLGFLHVS